jgi:natural product biosynthesis luciferase-like monooxygenase protein
VIAPESYDSRKELMFSNIRLIQKLWAGEAVNLPGVDGKEISVRTLPRPIQKTLPIWITSSGSDETWVKAGELGANILTGVRGDPFDDLAKKINLYYGSLIRHGHDPQRAKVTAMLHTYVSDDVDDVKEKVRAPLSSYVRTFIAQGENLSSEHLGLNVKNITDEDKDALAAMAFERFFNSNSLLGDLEKCVRVIDKLKRAGVDEVACLIDFGVDTGSVIKSLNHLNELREHCNR